MKISAVLISRDAEDTIGKALDSVRWADEVIVLDCGSSDQTVEVCRAAGARVESQDWPGYVKQKNAVAELAGGEWILSLDADEEVTPELRLEIEAILRDPNDTVGFRIPRKNHYLGRWIRHCGWYPDHQLRLWRSGAGKWVGGRVHERVQVEGKTGKTQAAINHYSYRSISHHLDRINQYSALIAQDKFDAGKRTGPLRILFSSPWQFFRVYLLRGGFLDGIPGLIVSAMAAYYAFLKKVKLWELQLKDERKTRSGAD